MIWNKAESVVYLNQKQEELILLENQNPVAPGRRARIQIKSYNNHLRKKSADG